MRRARRRSDRAHDCGVPALSGRSRPTRQEMEPLGNLLHALDAETMIYQSSSSAKADDPVTTGLSDKTEAGVYWMPRFRGA